ncbi:CDP-diacylglycerol--serine O-phosphatidyltransferase [Echinicola strongylocentroti]|uniref:CDP-diacylglycerol--serine O-phosphatidyltransferase n=1 Tax=Echinicola strongylocentroti TaxID=1795355 RepID=A0A2Z4IPV2_9BACT|nr:CDP-diacylglycerol--serine O-phosphatidyltransferase [Echinicola strongylocentroti]AWW32323.1 CDP-diacylglycerol--serine O-phosphatidyltransferase [Echinicola strongylocentroti]
MNIKKNIPNAITCMNLASGMAGIYYVLEGNLYAATYFTLAAAMFDFLDGMVARLLKVHSEIGKQLDSLADMVTFGVLPSFVLFQLMKVPFPDSYLPFCAFLIGIQSAMRLAKFNIDTRQSDRFIGVPTPANALLVCTLPFLADRFSWADSMIQNGIFLLAMTLVLAMLLTAELPLIALKFKNFGWADNIFRYLVIAIAVVSILGLGLAGVPFVIVGYILLSIIENQVKPA